MIMKNKNQGFTMVELVIVIGIMSVSIVGLLSLFLYTSVQGEMSGNKTLAVKTAQSKVEEIRNHTYSLIAADYALGGTPGNTFDISGVTGKGVVYIDSTNAPCSAELLCIEIDVSWQNKYGRMIGEDINYNGVPDAGEDVNVNNRLDSPVKIVSMITRR